MPKYQNTGRIMRRNHSNAMPRYIVAFDTETKPNDDTARNNRRTHRFRLGTAISARMVADEPTAVKRHILRQPADVWKLLSSVSRPNYTTWCIAHGAIFDLVVSGMTEKFEQGELTIEWPRSVRTREDNNEDNSHCKTLCVIDSPPTIIACKLSSTQGRIVFVDSLNWFPVALAELGSAMGLEKCPMPGFDDDAERWLSYCQRDTEIVFTAFVQLIKWVRENDMGMFRYTAASQAMAAFRHRFMKHQIYVHDNAEVKTLERNGYFGGRTEVFRLGEINETVYQLDINSLFPSVMQAGRFPVKLTEFEIRRGISHERPEASAATVMAEVHIKTDTPVIPIKTDKGIIYPVGEFKTVLCGPELAYAEAKGIIQGYGSYAIYELQPLFKNWVDELWKMRAEYKASGNRLYEQFVKRLMNSLYGKFAQKSPAWVNVPGVDAALPWDRWCEKDYTTGTVTEYRSFGWQVQKCVERGEIESTFIAISAFVTSAARMRMNLIRYIAGQRNVYYQGVDSVIVTQAGRDRLEQAGELSDTDIGKLKLELVTNTGEIVGHSDYRLGEKIVIAGRALSHEIRENGVIMQRRFGALTDLFSGSSHSEINETVSEWHRTASYHKGNVGKDGWIHPLVMTTPVDGSISGDNSLPDDRLASAST